MTLQKRRYIIGQVEGMTLQKRRYIIGQVEGMTLQKRRYIIGQGEGMTLQKKLMSPLNIHRAKNSRGVQTAYIQYVCI